VFEVMTETVNPENEANGIPVKSWYVVKVQSGREDSIKEGLLKRVKMQGLEDYFGEIIVPSEKVSEIKGGKKKVTERKFYPGYMMVNMAITDETWYLVRSIPGVGDFVGGASGPTPMEQHEVDKMLGQAASKTDDQPRLKISFEKGETVKIKEGPFENFEGSVDEVLEGKGLVRVMVEIFGRATPVELEYWQVERV
jgi:transcription termination/antitermination protein NusG